MRVTNSNLRDLLYSANNIAAVEAEDVFYAGYKPSNERANQIQNLLNDAEKMFKELYTSGKFSQKALRGCPGQSQMTRWIEELKTT